MLRSIPTVADKSGSPPNGTGAKYWLPLRTTVSASLLRCCPEYLTCFPRLVLPWSEPRVGSASAYLSSKVSLSYKAELSPPAAMGWGKEASSQFDYQLAEGRFRSLFQIQVSLRKELGKKRW